MSEMVERAALVLTRMSHEFRGATVPVDVCRDLAVAVIKELRVPNFAMQIAGHNMRNDPATGAPTSCGTDEIYTAMIDAALVD